MPHKVLRVKDPHDSYHIKKDLFDLPMSLIVVGKSQLSGKSNFLTWLLCSESAGYTKDFDGENIFIVSPSFTNDNKLKIIQRQFDIPPTNIIPIEALLTGAVVKVGVLCKKSPVSDFSAILT